MSSLNALVAELRALPEPPVGPLRAPVATFTLGPHAKLHVDRRCPALDGILASRLIPGHLPLSELDLPSRCGRCEYRHSSLQRDWLGLHRAASHLRDSALELLEGPLASLLAAEPLERGTHRAELTAAFLTFDDALSALAEHDRELDEHSDLELSDREEMVEFLDGLRAPILALRTLALPELRCFDEELELRVRTELASSANLDAAARDLAAELGEDAALVPGASLLRGQSRYGASAAPTSVLVTCLFLTGLQHLLATGSLSTLDAAVTCGFETWEDVSPPRTLQLPTTCTLDPAPFTTPAGLNLAAFAQAAWEHEAARARLALTAHVTARLTSFLDDTRLADDLDLVLVATTPDISGSWRGLDVTEVLARFPRLADTPSLHVIELPRVLARWLELVSADYERVVLGTRLPADSDEVFLAAASLAADADDPLEALPAFLITARELFATAA